MKIREDLFKKYIFFTKKIAFILILLIISLTIILLPMIPNLIQLTNDLIRLKNINSKIEVINEKIDSKNSLIEENNKLLSVSISSDENAKKQIEDDSSLLEKAMGHNCFIKSIGTTLIDNTYHPVIKIQREIKITGNWPSCSRILFDISSKMMSYIKDFSISSLNGMNVEIVFMLYHEGLLYETYNQKEPAAEKSDYELL